jgi:hypothetical protein
LGTAVQTGFVWLGAFVVLGILGLASERGTVQDVLIFSAVGAAVLTVLDRIWAWFHPSRRVSLGWGLLELLPSIAGYLAVLGLMLLFDGADGRDVFRSALVLTAALSLLHLVVHLVQRARRADVGI